MDALTKNIKSLKIDHIFFARLLLNEIFYHTICNSSLNKNVIIWVLHRN